MVEASLKSEGRIVLTKNMNMMRLYLANKRQIMGLSMRETSRRLSMDVHHYYRIECGLISRVSFLTLCNIAQVLEISLDDLYEMETIYQLGKEK